MEVAAFHPSETAKQRVADLIQLEKVMIFSLMNELNLIITCNSNILCGLPKYALVIISLREYDVYSGCFALTCCNTSKSCL